MAKEFKEIKSSSVDPPGKYSTFHKKIEEVAQKIHEGGILPEFTIETEGPPRIQPRGPAEITTSEPRLIKNIDNTPLRKVMYGKKSLEKKGLEIKPGENIGLEGGSDYWITKRGDILGEVDIESGNVIGVNTPNPGELKRKKNE